MPLVGKTPGNFHFKKLDCTPGVFLNKDYILVMDAVKTIYRYDLEGKKQNGQKPSDKLIAMELCPNSTFIELYPTEKDIWALNSMR